MQNPFSDSFGFNNPILDFLKVYQKCLINDVLMHWLRTLGDEIEIISKHGVMFVSQQYFNA